MLMRADLCFQSKNRVVYWKSGGERINGDIRHLRRQAHHVELVEFDVCSQFD